MAAALMVAGIGAGLAGGEPAAVAGAASTTCSYEADGLRGPRGNYIRVHQPADPPTLFLRRSGRRILLETTGLNAPTPVECSRGTPTVDNIDRISLVGDGTRRLTLDLRTGRLGPGASERGRGAEIEILVRVTAGAGPQRAKLAVLAGDAPNVLTAGRRSGREEINLNARRERRDDSDLVVGAVEYVGSFFRAGSGGGDDTIDYRGPGRLAPSDLAGRIFSGAGGDLVFGSDSEGGNSITGGGGRDRLFGGRESDDIEAGDGRDSVYGRAGDDAIESHHDGFDRIHCGPGRDSALVSDVDRVRACEQVTRVLTRGR